MPETNPIAAARLMVYLIEDDPAVRDALCILLDVKNYRVRAFSSAEAFMLEPSIARPAIALVDLRLPGINGLELQRRVARDHPALPMIMITGHGDVSAARNALRQGAVDFLEKPIDEHELMQAIDTAFAREAQHLSRERDLDAVRQRLERLTDRETEVFRRVTDGLHNREIAAELGISPRTVEVHRARLMDKLEARRVADLFRIRMLTDDAFVA